MVVNKQIASIASLLAIRHAWCASRVALIVRRGMQKDCILQDIVKDGNFHPVFDESWLEEGREGVSSFGDRAAAAVRA